MLSKYCKKSSITTALSVQNFTAGGPTISELSSKEKSGPWCDWKNCLVLWLRWPCQRGILFISRTFLRSHLDNSFTEPHHCRVSYDSFVKCNIRHACRFSHYVIWNNVIFSIQRSAKNKVSVTMANHWLFRTCRHMCAAHNDLLLTLELLYTLYYICMVKIHCSIMYTNPHRVTKCGYLVSAFSMWNVYLNDCINNGPSCQMFECNGAGITILYMKYISTPLLWTVLIQFLDATICRLIPMQYIRALGSSSKQSH